MDMRILGVVIAVVVVVVVISSVAVFLAVRSAPSGGENENTGSGENQPVSVAEKVIIEMPLTQVKAAVATRESASQDNVEVYFCVQAERIENDNFAAGVVVNSQKSIVLIYDNGTGTIVSVENEYTASTSDEIQAMSTLVLKGTTSPYAQNCLGSYNTNKIVPFGITKNGTTYSFSYYDGYNMDPLNQWGQGTAELYDNGEVSILTHFWV